MDTAPAITEPAGRETIVVIDDEHAMRMSCAKTLAKVGFRVETFEDGVQGLEGVARFKPALLVVDLKMPGMSGMEVISRAHEFDPYIIIVVITGYATIDTAIEAMKAGAYDFLPKPFSPDELRLIVNRGLERRRLALESQRSEFERALMKRRFVTFVSHQLQSPLIAIHQYLDVLKHLSDSPESASKRREWLERCLKRTEELQAIIKDWLTLARVEGDSLSRRSIRVDLREIVPNILKTYGEMASASDVTLQAELPGDALPVTGDPICLDVLFDNLIVNAIKYNKPGGSVRVTGELVNGEVVISVADTGLGIAEKDRPFLFEEFYRVKPEGGARPPGTGLGLAICKKIVSEMGGAISVESQVGSGTTFRVCLPVWHERSAQNNPNRSSE